MKASELAKREQILERLLRQTWECLPPFLNEGCEHETDMEGLAALADTVRAALGEPPVDWQVFELRPPGGT